MEFCKKSQVYTLMYNKTKGIGLLKQDKRVKRVVSGKDYLKIFTNPITPKFMYDKNKLKNFYLCPVGEYEITITKHISFLGVDINRLDNIPFYGNHHVHICDKWSPKICWGSAENEVDEIKFQKDWYWLAKRCLDLLEDGDIEPGQNRHHYNIFTKLMYKYAYDKKNKKLMEKIDKLRKRKLKYYGYNNYNLNHFKECLED